MSRIALAIIGATIGDYMDRQEDELRRVMRDSGVTVTRRGDDIILNMPGNVTFRTASSPSAARPPWPTTWRAAASRARAS